MKTLLDRAFETSMDVARVHCVLLKVLPAHIIADSPWFTRATHTLAAELVRHNVRVVQ